MSPRHERRAAALEAIAHALLELAAVEREPEESATPAETLVDRRNCEKELGLTPRAFAAAAGRDFPAFRVSKRLTAMKADVLAWLKTRTVEPKPPRPREPPKAPDPDAFLQDVNARFKARVGRPMSDDELHEADLCITVGRDYRRLTGSQHEDTADEVAAKVQERIGKEPVYYASWRSLGLDPAAMDRDAEKLRQQLHDAHPEMGWRERVEAIFKMWDAISAPLSEARQARAASRAAKKAERVKLGQLGLKR